MKRGVVQLFTLALIMSSGTIESDVLLLDAIEHSPTNTTQGIPRPTRGMTMQTVKSRFGEPSKIHPRIGNPPITRWDYTDYSVFFEYQQVLTSVVHR